MNRDDIAAVRLRNQRIDGRKFQAPVDVVRWLGAVQSQDYHGAKWALGKRTDTCRDADVDRAYNEGKIIRTHILRPTWHFVAPEDLRWMLQATAPRVKALNAYMGRRLQLDDVKLGRTREIMAEALRGGRSMTRPELAEVLANHGIVGDKLTITYIMMDAELSGLLCSGPMSGKQHTYALLDERVAPYGSPIIGGQGAEEEATAELARRFFTGHGPATVADFAAWASLSSTAAQRATASVKTELLREVVDDRTLWFHRDMPAESGAVAPSAYLLSEYDECWLTYKDLSFADHTWTISRDGWVDSFTRPVIVDGKRAGVWRRTIAKKSVVVEVRLFAALSKAQSEALDSAAHRLGDFLQMPATLARPS